MRAKTAYRKTRFMSDEHQAEDLSEAELMEALTSLKLEHRRIDNEIKAIIETGVADMLKVGRMKKIKLSLKDQIVFIENQLTPDIIA